MGKGPGGGRWGRIGNTEKLRMKRIKEERMVSRAWEGHSTSLEVLRIVS